MPFTSNINKRLTDETKIDYSRTATLKEREIIYKAMMGSVIIHGNLVSFVSKTSDPRYANHLKALQVINQSAQRLWEGIQVGGRITNIDQICDNPRERTLLTENFVDWFYETLDVFKFVKKQQGFKNFYLAEHLPTTTLWARGKQHYYFKDSYYTHQGTVVACEDTEQKAGKPEYRDGEMIDFMHGGGLIYILHFLEGHSAGYPLCGNHEEARGIEVIVGNDRKSAAEDAKRALEWFFDYPAILTGKIRKQYLDTHDVHRAGIRSGIRGEFFNEIEVTDLQLVYLTPQEKQNFKYKIPDLTDFFTDLKKRRIKLKLAQLFNSALDPLTPLQ